MKSCEKCGRPIADTAAACPYCGYSQAAELPNALQPGWEIAGRYRIESVIGLGGFGITYCAYDQKLACTVALKEYFPSGVANRIPGSKEVILYAGKRTEEFRQGYTRFLNEARNMIQFQSVPNVVQVREYFEENGTAYIVMEYLRGHTLKTEIERAPLTWERAVTIGAVICGALTALHRKGIVHRDVSPDNIFLCDDGRIKLIDFGAARVSMQQTPLTVVFKDCFTPPEQYSRSAHQGPQTDIYALGATLYTAMLGKKPESALNRWPTDHLKAPHTLKPEIPEPVSNAVMQALALEPELRFSSAEEFSRALLQYQQTKSLEKTRKEKQRRKWISLLSVFLVLAIVGGTVGYLWISRTAQETLPDAAIDVWFTADPLRASGQNKIAALNAAASAFQTLYPNVELRLQSIAPDQYEQRLKQAQQDGSLPVLFERTAQSTDLACNAKALRQLNRQYDPAGFRLGAPVSGDYAVLGLGLPVLYASNACAEGIGFDFRQASSATLASLAGLDLKAGMDASFLPAYEVLFQSSIPETDSMTVSADALDAFLSGEQGLYYGSTADAADVQTQLAGRYQLYAVQSPERACMLQNVWSVTQQSSKKETACAVRFLSYLLSEDGQRCLYLENQYPCIPVSSTVYEQYRNIAGELADVLTDAKPRPCGIV